MSQLPRLRADLAEAEENVKVCDDMLALDPQDVDAREMKTSQQEIITELKAQIAAATAQQINSSTEPAPPPALDDAIPPPPPPAAPPKYDMSKHPKFREAAEVPPPPPPSGEQHTFNVKDTVMAKYSEDKQWYQASVISKTGSAADPVYTVTFKGYGNTETKRKHEIRALHNPNEKKRKADALNSPAVVSSPATPTSPKPVVEKGGHVISAAPAVDISVIANQPPKYVPSKVSDGPTRMAPEPKKLKGQKQLQKNQSNWQAWAAAGPKKTGAGAGFAPAKNKPSMFRTPDLPGAKVGFTGSGKGMQKDQARAKWNYGGAGGED